MLRKVSIVFMSLIMTLSFSSAVFADQTTTLTTTVPSATYTLNIPSDQTIEFGTTEKNLGNISITNSSGFAVGKDVSVTVTCTPFSSETTNTTIPYTFSYQSSLEKYSYSKPFIFKGKANGVCDTYVSTSTGEMTGLLLKANSADWAKALGGDYTSTITF